MSEINVPDGESKEVIKTFIEDFSTPMYISLGKIVSCRACGGTYKLDIEDFGEIACPVCQDYKGNPK